MCRKRYHIVFSTISLKFKRKISVQKEVIHSFTGVSSSIGDWRILCILRIILQLNFDEVWLFFFKRIRCGYVM